MERIITVLFALAVMAMAISGVVNHHGQEMTQAEEQMLLQMEGN